MLIYRRKFRSYFEIKKKFKLIYNISVWQASGADYNRALFVKSDDIRKARGKTQIIIINYYINITNTIYYLLWYYLNHSSSSRDSFLFSFNFTRNTSVIGVFIIIIFFFTPFENISFQRYTPKCLKSHRTQWTRQSITSSCGYSPDTRTNRTNVRVSVYYSNNIW